MSNKEIEDALLKTLEAVKSIATIQNSMMQRELLIVDRIQILEDEIRFLKDNTIQFSRS